VHKIEAATHQREHLIAQAKEAWRKKQEAPKADGAFPFRRWRPRFPLVLIVVSSTRHRSGGPAIRPRKANCAMGGHRIACILSVLLANIDILAQRVFRFWLDAISRCASAVR
jgi:hypothetical protein